MMSLLMTTDKFLTHERKSEEITVVEENESDSMSFP